MPEPAENREPPTPDPGDGGGDSPVHKLFAAFIQEQRGGSLHTELSEQLAEVSAAVVDLQKAGTLTLELKVAPAGKDQQAVIVTDKVKVKAPEDRAASMYFTDGYGNLSRRDPRQPELPLRDVSRPDKPPREVE